jgi:DNA-binding FrmR family transcriptional regulator
VGVLPAFLVVGSWGSGGWPRASALFVESASAGRALFFAGVALTGVGSAYYHWAPDNARLVWDRLPMTIGFMALLAAVVAERVSVTAGIALLPALLLAGAGSVAYWYACELRGAGDLRPYALVQFAPAALIPLPLLLFPARYTRGGDLVGVMVIYGAAKLFEVLDGPIFSMGHLLSGHTLKHLTAARGLVAAAGSRRQAPGGRGGADMMDGETKTKALGRLRRIEGQVQGIQRMVEEEKYCVDILLQLTAVEGAVEQVQRLLLGRHIESCVADAIRSGSTRDRQRKVDELLEVFSRFSGR